MTTINTYIVTFKSGKIEKVFAKSISELKKMITFENTIKVTKLI